MHALMIDDGEADDLRAQSRLERRIFSRLLRNPNPSDPDFPEDLYPALEAEPDNTLERLTECAQRCQDWLLAMKLAAELGQTEKAWQALEELGCEVNQAMEERP